MPLCFQSIISLCEILRRQFESLDASSTCIFGKLWFIPCSSVFLQMAFDMINGQPRAIDELQNSLRGGSCGLKL
jgi:hypothetical protein